MSRIDESIQAKREKREQLISEGVVPHPYSFAKQHTIAQALALENTVVTTAGRIMSIRTHGSVTFLDLQDTTANMQVMIRKSAIPEATYKQLQTLVDRGDFYGVTGEVTRTKTNEITIAATEVTFLGKTLRPLPTQWNAADDKEARFRQRYLDMLVNPETKRVLDIRWQTEKEIRRYLQDRFDFVEVETPILQTLYGGTNAKPFHTHMNALDSDFYLRIAPELYLKRLIVGGYERIFEIARNFRNEGIDQTHQPEFTMIEWYHAYADYHTIMDVAEGLLRHLVQTVHGKSTLIIGETAVDVAPAWPRITMTEAIKRHLQFDFDAQSDEELQTLMQQHKMELIGEFTRGKALFLIFDKLVAPLLIEPTWIINYPRDVSPLAKKHRVHDELAERFECYIGGKELCDGWSEITDPIDQRAIFENEQKRMRSGDSEAHPLDEDFLEAMEHGMPPLGGIGMGIDRLVMFLTNTWSIREVIAFPTLRPKTPQKITDAAVTISKPTQTVQSIAHTTQANCIDAAVSTQFPGMFFAYTTISGVKIQKNTPELEKQSAAVLATLKGGTTDSIGQRTAIQEYRKLLKTTGTDYHSKRPSPEALLRRIAQGKDLYHINTAVDAYNLAVLETGIGLGGFDATTLKLPVVLRFSKEGEQMLLLGDDQPTTTREGQLIYADAAKPITIDLNYRDIAETKITEETTDVILFADGAQGLSHEEVLTALQKGAEYIQQYCGGAIAKITLCTSTSSRISPKIKSDTSPSVTSLPPRSHSEKLLADHVTSPALLKHSYMVATAMEAYAKELNEDGELWYQAGLLHDLDWELHPDAHPNKAITEILTEYPDALLQAIAAHAPDRTSKQAETTIERYLFACDELSGLMHAVSLMRPGGFSDMQPKSIKKKLKDKSFAANVSREDIEQGLALIGKTADEHIAFLIGVFQKE